MSSCPYRVHLMKVGGFEWKYFLWVSSTIHGNICIPYQMTERCKIIFGFEWCHKPSLHTRSKVVKARCFQKVQFPWFGPISFSDIINFVRKVSLWRRRRNWSKQRELKLLEASRWTRFPRKISPWRPKSPRPKNQHIIFYFVLLFFCILYACFVVRCPTY